MDSREFDRLARLIGAGASRRRVLKSIAGGAVGTLAAAFGLEQAGAARLRAPGQACSKDADCAAHACLPKDRTGRRVCGECRSASDCPAGDQCHAVSCTNNTCGSSVNVGALCTDGNVCTTGETCQANGTCGGGAPVVCNSPDQCQQGGTCDPLAGDCVYQPKDDGTPCNDGDACTQSDRCLSGVCGGGSLVLCPPASDQCHVAGVCNTGSGLCSAETPADGIPCDSGGGAGSGTCHTGICVTNPIPCPAYPDACPTAQYCSGSVCACHIGVCTIGPDCGPYFDGCLGGCCCAENGNPNVGCVPGPNIDCCSGYCAPNQRCAAVPG